MESCDGTMIEIGSPATGIMENHLEFTGTLRKSSTNPPANSTKLPAFSTSNTSRAEDLERIVAEAAATSNVRGDSTKRSASAARGGGGSRPATALAELAEQEADEQTERSTAFSHFSSAAGTARFLLWALGAVTNERRANMPFVALRRRRRA